MVLIVGDDADSNELLSRVLVANGYRTASAGALGDALQKIGELLPRCVVLDLASGGIGSNLKVLEAIRSSGDGKINRSRVVLIARSQNNKVFSFQSGVDEFLVRPFHAKDLVAAVTASIDRPQDDRAAHRQSQIDSQKP